MSQHIERIDAWTWSNAYAWIPFFTHTARAFGVISLEDWVLGLRFSNLRVKFAKQEVMLSIIFITSPIPRSTSHPFDCFWFPLPFSCPLGLWKLTFFNAWSLWQFGLVCPRIPQGGKSVVFKDLFVTSVETSLLPWVWPQMDLEVLSRPFEQSHLASS